MDRLAARMAERVAGEAGRECHGGAGHRVVLVAGGDRLAVPGAVPDGGWRGRAAFGLAHQPGTALIKDHDVHGDLRVSVRPASRGGMGQPGLIMTRCGAAAPRARSRVRACGVSTKVKDVQPNVKSRASRVSRWRHPQPSREVFMHQLQLGNRVQDLAASAALAGPGLAQGPEVAGPPCGADDGTEADPVKRHARGVELPEGIADGPAKVGHGLMAQRSRGGPNLRTYQASFLRARRSAWRRPKAIHGEFSPTRPSVMST